MGGAQGIRETFGEITDDEIGDFSGILSSLTKIFDLRYNKDFPLQLLSLPGWGLVFQTHSQTQDTRWF